MSGAAARALPQCVRRPRAREVPRRQTAEEDPRGDGDAEGEQEDTEVEPDLMGARQVHAGLCGEQELEETFAEDEARDAAGECEKDALGEKLSRDPRAIGA